MTNAYAISKLLFDNTNILVKLVTYELGKFGITLPQALFLDTISQGPRTIGEISASIGLAYSTVSGIADRLERNGIIVRYRDPEDRRIVRVKISENLDELKSQYPVLDQDYFPAFFADLLSGISEEDEKALRKSLLLIHGYLEKKKKPR